MQHTILDGKIGIGRYHINLIGQYLHSRSRKRYCHFCMTRQNFRELAICRRVKMKDNYKCHARAGRHGFKERSARLQTPG